MTCRRTSSHSRLRPPRQRRGPLARAEPPGTGPHPEGRARPPHLDYHVSRVRAAAITRGWLPTLPRPSLPLPPWAQASAQVSAPGSGGRDRARHRPRTAPRWHRVPIPKGPAAGSPPPRRDPPVTGAIPTQGNTRPGRVDPVARSHRDCQPSSSTGRAAPGGPGGYPAGTRWRSVVISGSGQVDRVVAGAVVLKGAAVVAGVLISRSGQPSSRPRRSVSSSTVQPAASRRPVKSVCDPERKRERAGASASSGLPRPGTETAIGGGDSAE
jgi:hypothetical protein